MKKILLTSLMVTLVTGAAFAQGSVTLANNASEPIQTNTIALGGPSGNTQSGVGGTFDYEVLTYSTSGALGVYAGNLPGYLTQGGSLSPLNNTNLWTDTGIAGTNGNSFTGRVTGESGIAGNWPAGQTNDFIVLGWSANLGSLSTVLADLSTATLNAQNGSYFWTGISGLTAGVNYFLGASTVGFLEAGGAVGTQTVPTPNLFSAASSASGTPVTSSTELYIVQVPEPTTFALMGLGAASLLIFRRRQ